MQGRSRVTVREIEVPLPNWPASLTGLRIAHISDLHLRKWDQVAESAQGLLKELDFDLLVATGDFGSFRRHWQKAADLTRRFFEPLRERGPIYAVLGNHDDPRIATAADIPLTFLRNESQRIEWRGGEFTLAGVEQCNGHHDDPPPSPLIKGGSPQPGTSTARPCHPVVLLAHYPSTVFRLPEESNVCLMLSGHTHGGQIRFPGVGCLWPNDRIPRRMAMGLHRVGQTMVHVSAGIGVSLPLRVRINCPPEIAVLTARCA